MQNKDHFSAVVMDVSHRGLGVVQHESGMKFFVPGVWPGDHVDLEITQLDKRFGFAKLIKLVKPSSERVSPSCKHLGYELSKCGGCPWMIADYPAQLRMKEKLYKQELSRAQVDLASVEIFNVKPSAKTVGYRSRAQFKTNGIALGYVSPNSKELAPIEDCLILTDKNRQTLNALLKTLPNESWRAKNQFIWSLIDIDDGTELQHIKINQRLPFQQSNAEQNNFIQNGLREGLVIENKKYSVLELFCGSGNFTKIIAELGFANILALELDAQAVENLNHQNLKNVSASTAELFGSQSLKKFKSQVEQAQILVLDPPREGFALMAQWVTVAVQLKKIFYISCDASTFARDVKSLEPMGWKLKTLLPVDMFPHTPHIELFATLEKS